MCLAIDIKPQSYTNFKSSDTLPPVETISKIADYLNTSIDYLVTGKEPSLTNNKLEQIRSVLSENISLENSAEYFWEKVKQLCKERKISQKDLSIALGKGERTIEQNIYLQSEPSINDAVAIANYFDCSLYSLIKRTDVQDETYYREQIKAIKEILDS